MPPEEKKGSEMPVLGRVLVTTAMLQNQKEDEQHDDDHRADEAQFLAHDTEDKVVGALRQPELLFDAVAKAQPRGTA